MVNFWNIILAIIFVILFLLILVFKPFSNITLLNSFFNFFSTNYKVGWGLLLFIIYILNLGLIIYFNPLSIASNFTKTFVVLSIITGILNLFALVRLTRTDSKFKILSWLLIFYGLIFTIYYYIVFTPWPLTIMITVLNILLVIGVLSIMYKTIFSSSDTKKDGKGKRSKKQSLLLLIKHLIFYIPCLFIDLIEWIKHQYKITTKTVWIILLIEILVIILRFIIPYLYKIYNRVDGYLVEKGPVYLNNETNLGTFQNIKSTKNLTKYTNINYNYAISTWIWINPQPQSTNSKYNKSTTLLNYGDVLNINFNKNKLEFWAFINKKNKNNKNNNNTMHNNLKKIYELNNIHYQKWNNIIFNYDGGTLDIFINNVLVSSTINITPIMYYSNVISGSTNGINGGIKNLTYYDKVLTKNDIYSIYSIG